MTVHIDRNVVPVEIYGKSKSIELRGAFCKCRTLKNRCPRCGRERCYCMNCSTCSYCVPNQNDPDLNYIISVVENDNRLPYTNETYDEQDRWEHLTEVIKTVENDSTEQIGNSRRFLSSQNDIGPKQNYMVSQEEFWTDNDVLL